MAPQIIGGRHEKRTFRQGYYTPVRRNQQGYKDLTLDLDGYKVYNGQESIDLTPREFEILRELLTHKGRILTRQNLLQTLWKYEFFGEERIIDTHIKNLRKKLGTADYIETIRGVGYRIDKEN